MSGSRKVRLYLEQRLEEDDWSVIGEMPLQCPVSGPGVVITIVLASVIIIPILQSRGRVLIITVNMKKTMKTVLMKKMMLLVLG